MALIPPAFSNPSTFFMKCMNPEGLLVENMQKTQNYDIALTPEIKAAFKERVIKMVNSYRESDNFKQIKPSSNMEIPKENDVQKTPWFTQYSLITKRGVLNEFRNPMDLRTRYASTIILSLVICLIFAGVIVKI